MKDIENKLNKLQSMIDNLELKLIKKLIKENEKELSNSHSN